LSALDVSHVQSRRPLAAAYDDGDAMTVWLLLASAIVCEVTASLSLKRALEQPVFYVVVAIGYVTAFILLTLTLKEGLGIGVAYGIWAACGVALTAVASKIFFSEPLTGAMMVGIGLIIAGVLLVETGASH
jgi:small multidrug resistance pump